MKSTDNNLNNPLKVDTLHLAREVESWQYMTIKKMPQMVYDALNFYDPFVAYVITDHPGKVYYGSDLVKEGTAPFPCYYMGITKEGEYGIYFNYQGISVQICRYDDPQKAFNVLHVFHNTRTHHKSDIKAYNIITSYIEKNITCNQMIISLMDTLSTYTSGPHMVNMKDAPGFQTFIHTLTLDQADDKQEDISRLLREDLYRWKDGKSKGMVYSNPAVRSYFKIYSDFYDIIVKYDHFKDKKYHDPDGDIDLSDVIGDLIKAIIVY